MCYLQVRRPPEPTRTDHLFPVTTLFRSHRRLGEEPAAVFHVAPGQSATEAELQAWVRERLAAFKVPVAIRFVADTLPRNANGKILKKDLKALFADRDAAAA